MHRSLCLNTVYRRGGAGDVRAGEMSAPLTPSPQIMPIRLRCPECQTLLQVADDAVGKRTRCPQCKQLVAVPASAAPGEVIVAQRRDDRLPPSTHRVPQPAAPHGDVRQVRCPRCRQAMRAMAGSVVSCPGCRATVKVPPAATHHVADLSPFDDLPPPSLGSTGSPPQYLGTPSPYRAPASPPPGSGGSRYQPEWGSGGYGMAGAERLPSGREAWYYAVPGVIFLLFSILLILAVLLNLISLTLVLARAGNIPPPGPERDRLVVLAIQAGLGLLISFPIGLIYLFGGLAMIRRRGLTMARTTAVVACIPCFNAIILTPIGIWACILVFGRSAERDFDD